MAPGSLSTPYHTQRLSVDTGVWRARTSTARIGVAADGERDVFVTDESPRVQKFACHVVECRYDRGTGPRGRRIVRTEGCSRNDRRSSCPGGKEAASWFTRVADRNRAA